MNQILKELLKIMQDTIEPKVRQDVLVRFFLGEKNEWIDASIVNKIKNGKMNLDSDKRESLVNSTDFTMERLQKVVKAMNDKEKSPKNSAKEVKLKVDSCKQVKQLQGLCKKHKLAYQQTDSVAILVNRLVLLCFLKTPYTEQAFIRDSLSESEYVSWKNKENELSQNIKKNHITFVYGSAACGKKQLVEHFLHNKQTSDYVFVDYTSSSKKDCVQVDYILNGIQEVLLDKFLIQCSRMEKNDYVIITWHYFEQKDMVRVVKMLEKLKAKVIIITRTSIVPEGCGVVYVEKWPRKQMLKIVKRNYPRPCARTEYYGLIELLQYNPYLIEIISTYLRTNKEQSLEEFLRILREDGVSEVIALSKGKSHKIHSTYREKNKGKPTHPIATFLARCLESCNDEDIDLLCRLLIWTQTSVDIDFLVKIGKFKNKEIDRAIERNYLMYTDKEKNMVQMFPVFSWALSTLQIEVDERVLDDEFIKTYVVVNGRKVELDENGVRTGIDLLVKMAGSNVCSSDNIEYFYATIINIICRYHRVYSNALNIEGRRWGEYYRFWTHFLELAAYRFRTLGNVEQAEWINEKVYKKYKRKESYYDTNKKQNGRTKLENFNLQFLQNALTEKDWDITFEVLTGGDTDIAWLHTPIDFFMYQEMGIIINTFIKNPDEKYMSFSKKSVLVLLEHYFLVLNKKKLSDEKADLYGIFYYYLKSLYQDRKWLECVSVAGNSVFNNSQDPYNDENCLRAQLYYVFFEMLMKWKDENITLRCMRESFIPYIRGFAEILQTRILSMSTTNTALLVMMVSDALLLIRKIDVNVYGENFELFEWISSVFSEQYRVKGIEYQKLNDAIQKANKEIDEVLDFL